MSSEDIFSEISERSLSVQRIRWARLEIKPFIPTARRFILRMDEECSDAGNVRHLSSSQSQPAEAALPRSIENSSFAEKTPQARFAFRGRIQCRLELLPLPVVEREHPAIGER